MRILHVSEVHWGGVVGLVHEFVNGQISQGDESMLLAPPAFPAPELGRTEPWRIVRNRPATFPGAVAELRRTVATFKPDVVHLHSFMAGFIGRLPGAMPPTPLVYQPHSWSFDVSERRWTGSAIERWERFAGSRTDMLVTNCEAEIDDGRLVGITSPATSLGVAIDTDHYHPVDHDQKEIQRKACGVEAGRMLVCIGRITRQKAQDQLVVEWERQRPDDTELVLVGPGETAELEALAPTQWGRTIRAVGEQTDVRPWLWAADALILPSRYEGTAMVFGEAMACGRPVITTAVNGTEYVVGTTRAAAGRVVALGDMGSLLEQADQLLADPQLLESLGDVGRERALTEFAPAEVAARLRGAYERAIAGSRSQSPLTH